LQNGFLFLCRGIHVLLVLLERDFLSEQLGGILFGLSCELAAAGKQRLDGLTFFFWPISF
jgi:hypothetical protein